MSDTVTEQEKATTKTSGDEKADARAAFENKVKSKTNTKVEENKENSTYLSIMNEEDVKMLEFDLVFIRQRGTESRFLEINLKEAQEVQGQNVTVDHLFEVKTKEEFDKLNNYFAN